VSASASRYELSDRNGGYLGTFVSSDPGRQIGDVFTTGDGKVLRIVGLAEPEQSAGRPAYAGGWIVEPA
jgi:hypothetical protein